MRYLWTEDTGAGLHFLKLVNRLFSDNELVVESKGSNQGLLDALIDLETEDGDEYFVAFDYVVDNQDIRNKYRILKSITDKSEGKIVILDMICFEYLILAFDKLVKWTGTGKRDKIKIREEVLTAVENHRIDLSRIDDKKTLQYLAGFKRYPTERVMKSLVGEFTQNEKWSVKGTFMGECWYKDCCVSEHTDNLRCGKPEVEGGDEKMRMLIRSEEVQRLMRDPAFLEADDQVSLSDSYEKATKKLSKKKIEQYDKILKLLNDGEWHKTAEIADNLGLKDTRTKELLKELIALDKLIDNGKTKGKLYRLK